MKNSNVAVLDRWVEAVLGGKPEWLNDLAHPDLVLYQARGLEYAGTYRGVDGFLEFMKKFEKAYTMESIERIGSFTSEERPDVVIAGFHITGVLNSSGRKFDATNLELWEFRDGKVWRIRPHYYEHPN